MLRCRLALVRAVVGSALLATDSAAEIYRYVDGQGREQFTTDLNRVPPSQRESAQGDAAGRPGINRSQDTGASPRRGGSILRQSPGPARMRRKVWDVPEERPGGRDEASWRTEHQRRVKEIEQLENTVANLEELGADNEPPSYRGNISRRNFARYHSRYGAYQRAVRDLERKQSALEAFEERARRAGVPPGWLR